MGDDDSFGGGLLSSRLPPDPENQDSGRGRAIVRWRIDSHVAFSGDEGPKATKGTHKSTSGAKSAGSGRALKPSRTQATDDEAEEEVDTGRSATELKRKLTAVRRCRRID
jgi:hypothetical protein